MTDKQLVMHAYNTSQSVMIQGKNCQEFAIKHLEPLLEKRINETQVQIQKVNNEVLDKLASKKRIQEVTKTRLIAHFVM